MFPIESCFDRGPSFPGHLIRFGTIADQPFNGS